MPHTQYDEYRQHVPMDIELIPFGGEGIGNKREFILHLKPTGKLIMFDDDLTFYKRISDEKFVKMTIDDSIQMLTDMVQYLDKYAMVGMVDKFMSQTRPRGHIECSRCNKVIGINRDLLPNPWPNFKILHDEDHHFHLQLITRGFRTAVLTEYSKMDGVQSPGGCTDWRSPEVFAETHRLLLEYWPGIVSVRGNKVAYRWKKAMEIGGLL